MMVLTSTMSARVVHTAVLSSNICSPLLAATSHLLAPCAWSRSDMSTKVAYDVMIEENEEIKIPTINNFQGSMARSIRTTVVNRWTKAPLVS